MHRARTLDWCRIGVAKRDKRLHLANTIKIGHRINTEREHRQIESQRINTVASATAAADGHTLLPRTFAIIYSTYFHFLADDSCVDLVVISWK